MDLSQSYAIPEEIVYREEDDGAFLFDPDSGNLKYMNLMGRKTFLMLREKADLEQVIDLIHGEHPDVDRDEIRKDLETFLMQLQQNTFITPLLPNA